MAKKHKPSAKLGHLQLAVLKSLWRRGAASVNDVHTDLYDALRLAPTTVATVLRRMEQKGLVTHSDQGRQFLYQSLVNEEEMAESAAEEVLDHLFEGRLAEMVSHLIDKRTLDQRELDRLANLIASKRKQLKAKDKG